MEPTKPWLGFDHVQLAMPAGGEDVARDFYVRVLGLAEVPKPPALAARCHIADPFGKRIELVDAAASGGDR